MKKVKLLGSLFGFAVGLLLLPALASAQSYNSSGNNTVTVYVQMQNNGNCNCPNNNYNTYSNYNCCNNNTYNNNSSWPGNFTISMTGINPTPASFQGSPSGTVVNLGSGYFSVSPDNQNGWSYSTSGTCSGYVSGGQSYSCTISYWSNQNNNNQYCPNSNYNGYNNCNPYPYPNQTLVCSPNYQQGGLGSTMTFMATGGNGYYNWSSGSYNYSGTGATLNAQFYSPGPQNVMVTSNGQSAYCSVNIVGTGYNYNYPNTYNYTPASVYTNYYYPHLPNTGFRPVSAWQYLLALALLITVGYLSYPYVRNAFTYLKR